MCDHTNDLGGREAAMVVLDPGTPERHGRDGVWCDPCLVPLIKALNDGGVRTIASCCGHGATEGWIALGDGRQLGIFATLNQFRKMQGLGPVEGGGDL